MQYIDSVNESFKRPSRKVAFSDEQLSHALSLRTSTQVSEVIEPFRAQLGLSEFSEADQHLFQTRTIGNMATRLALGSALTPNVDSFIELPDQQQLDALYELVEQYANNITAGSEEDLLTLDQSIDPLSGISHDMVLKWMFKARTSRIDLNARAQLVRSYANTRTGKFPPDPYPVTPVGLNDVTLTQAFGRDSISDDELISVRDMRMQLKNDNDMMDYLESIDFKPGPSNEALAEVIHQQLQTAKAPEQLAQWEVLYALRQLHPDTYKTYNKYLHGLWPHKGFYPTYEVKEDSVDNMRRLGLYNASELAHGDMMIRSIGILRKLKVIVDPIAADIPFDPLSAQEHVQNEKNWVGREKLARLEHLGFLRVRF